LLEICEAGVSHKDGSRMKLLTRNLFWLHCSHVGHKTSNGSKNLFPGIHHCTHS